MFNLMFITLDLLSQKLVPSRWALAKLPLFLNCFAKIAIFYDICKHLNKPIALINTYDDL